MNKLKKSVKPIVLDPAKSTRFGPVQDTAAHGKLAMYSNTTKASKGVSLLYSNSRPASKKSTAMKKSVVSPMSDANAVKATNSAI